MTAIPPSATAMNNQRNVSRYATIGRMAFCVLASTCCAQLRDASRATALDAAVLSENLTQRRYLGGKGHRSRRDQLALLRRRTKVVGMKPVRGQKPKLGWPSYGATPLHSWIAQAQTENSSWQDGAT